MTDSKGPDSRRWQNRSVVRERDERRVLWLWRTFFAIVVAITPAGTFLICSNDCLELSYRNSGVEAEYEQLLEMERQLTVERASLESLAGIERWANRHGLVQPDPGHVLVVRNSEGNSDGRLMARAPVPGPLD